MSRKTPEQVAEKYGRRVGQAGADYANGVQNPSASWADRTAASEEAWQQGINEAAAERRFSRGAQAAGDGKWQNGCLDRGQANYVGAAGRAADNYAQKAQHIMGAAEAARNAAAQVKGVGFEASQQRALAAMKATREYWRRVRGS